ncbi:MAG: holo-ACP synthase [Clostridia bacterium]|nr:holo-ACP synthase [Clostridia bacterium]
MEIGIDLEEIERFKNFDDKKLQRIFTENEINYARKFVNCEKNFCAMWCVKEAVIKVFSNKTINFKDIEVMHTENGKPYIVKNEIILNELIKNNCTEIKISISHSKTHSTAVCLIY